MYEAEVKILDINPEEIKKKLKALGAETVFENRKLKANYYDFSDNRIKKAKNFLRLRNIGNETELTFKHFVTDNKFKINEETDIKVDDFNAMHNLLIMLGLKKYGDYSKKRSRYKLGEFQYEIDKYQGIPAFLEVEAKFSNLKKAKKELEKAVSILGFEMKDTKTWNAFQVHKHYSKKMTGGN